MKQTISVPFTSNELAHLKFLLKRELNELEKDVQKGDIDPKDANNEMETNAVLLEKLEIVDTKAVQSLLK